MPLTGRSHKSRIRHGHGDRASYQTERFGHHHHVEHPIGVGDIEMMCDHAMRTRTNHQSWYTPDFSGAGQTRGRAAVERAQGRAGSLRLAGAIKTGSVCRSAEVRRSSGPLQRAKLRHRPSRRRRLVTTTASRRAEAAYCTRCHAVVIYTCRQLALLTWKSVADAARGAIRCDRLRSHAA